MYTNCVRSPGTTVASLSVAVALAWAPMTSVLNTAAEPTCANGIIGTCFRKRLLTPS